MRAVFINVDVFGKSFVDEKRGEFTRASAKVYEGVNPGRILQSRVQSEQQAYIRANRDASAILQNPAHAVPAVNLVIIRVQIFHSLIRDQDLPEILCALRRVSSPLVGRVLAEVRYKMTNDCGRGMPLREFIAG